MKISAPTYTQTPNDLFDHWMKFLGEGELKVLLLIMRKTFGWHQKEDQISLSQLEFFTGLTPTNIGIATKSLISKGLISKRVEGPRGKQCTYYSLVVSDDSNNSYPSCNGSRPLPQQESQNKDLKKEQQQGAQKSKEKKSSKPSAVAAVVVAPADASQCLTALNTPRCNDLSDADKHAIINDCLYLGKNNDDLLMALDCAYASGKSIRSRVAFVRSALKKGYKGSIKQKVSDEPQEDCQAPVDAKTIDENRAYAKKYHCYKGEEGIVVCAEEDYVEIGPEDCSFSTVIRYDEKCFLERFKEVLEISGIVYIH